MLALSFLLLRPGIAGAHPYLVQVVPGPGTVVRTPPAEVEIAFTERLRGMVRFDGVESLVETMRDDVARTREILGV